MGAKGATLGGDEYEEEEHKPAYRYGFRKDEYYLPDKNDVNVVEVAKRRFDFQAEVEAEKLQRN